MDTCNKLKPENQQVIGQFPDADAQLKQLFKVICNIEEMARSTPASVGESKQWSSIVSTAEEIRQNFYKALTGKTVFVPYIASRLCSTRNKGRAEGEHTSRSG
jgi:hypothetical protein